MIIAISGEFGDQLEQFIYYKVEKNVIRERETIFTPPGGVDALLKQFISLEIDLLIVHKITPETENALIDAGIAVISGISGEADPILKEYLNGTLDF